MNIKLAIIYYSSTGTNYAMAREAEKAAKEKGLTDIRFRKFPETAPESAIDSRDAWREHVDATQHVDEVSLDDLEWADAIVFSIPTRYGNLPAQVQSFFDTTGGLWSEGKLANKVVSGMTSAQNPHGGQESTLLSLYKTMYHWGALVVPPGYTAPVLFKSGGNPYGLSVDGGKDNVNGPAIKSIHHQTGRTIQVASWVREGLQNN